MSCDSLELMMEHTMMVAVDTRKLNGRPQWGKEGQSRAEKTGSKAEELR